MTWPTEVIAMLSTTIATILGGAGFFVKWSLGQAEKRVEAAEKREESANARAKDERDVQNKRIDGAIEAIHAQSKTIGELVAAIKILTDGSHEDMKKVNDGITTLLARADAGRRT